LSGRGLCDRSISRSEESYRVWGTCDREISSKNPRPPRVVEPWEEKIYTFAYLIFIIPNAKNAFVELAAYFPTVGVIQRILFVYF